MYRAFFKRLIDMVAAASVLVGILPFMVFIAIIIYLQDRGPVFFAHERVGRNGLPFRFLKFRSMPVNTPVVESHQVQQLKITPFGKFLRRTNLDELPQLINILKGDMSLIGPRPCLPKQTNLIALRTANGAISLKPGLTGWAQVNSYDFMPEEKKAEFDGEYGRKISFLLDCKIVLLTLKYLTKKPPVY